VTRAAAAFLPFSRRMKRTEKLLAELIALPSVNPAFAPLNETSSHQKIFGEKNVADFLAATAAKAGLDVEFQNVFTDRFNVVARLRPKNKIRQTILLAPHLDTVGADEKSFIPKIKNGRLHGRGACDTKGSVAAMLSALCELSNSKIRPVETEIVFAGLIDEEHAQAGSRALAKKFSADLAIVGEPTNCRVVTAHKGSLWLNLETRGRAAHGATPSLGKNAVHEMARVVDILETKYAAVLKQRNHPLLGSPTVNVGKISGGAQPNIVPEKCVIEVDRRTLPGETEQRVKHEITALLKANSLTAKISSAKIAPALPLETDCKIPLVQKFLLCAGQKNPLGVHYFCDAAVLSAGGIPSVVFGPGAISQAHTADEWIVLSELGRAKNLLLKFLSALP
jgi:acetylornithine deacetylase/succinyl-diaminopimelate desuccinylase-like protein